MLLSLFMKFLLDCLVGIFRRLSGFCLIVGWMSRFSRSVLRSIFVILGVVVVGGRLAMMLVVEVLYVLHRFLVMEGSLIVVIGLLLAQVVGRGLLVIILFFSFVRAGLVPG